MMFTFFQSQIQRFLHFSIILFIIMIQQPGRTTTPPLSSAKLTFHSFSFPDGTIPHGQSIISPTWKCRNLILMNHSHRNAEAVSTYTSILLHTNRARLHAIDLSKHWKNSQYLITLLIRSGHRLQIIIKGNEREIYKS